MRAPCASKALGELALPSRASGGPWLALFLLPPSPSPPSHPPLCPFSHSSPAAPPPSLPPSPSPALPGCSLRNQTNRPCVSTGVGQIAVGPPLIQGRPPQNGVSPLAGGAVHGARLSPTRAPTACAPAQLALRRNRFLWLRVSTEIGEASRGIAQGPPLQHRAISSILLLVLVSGSCRLCHSCACR